MHVSKDGAYRRIGGRTALTLQEAMELAKALNLDFADFVGMAPGKMIFDHLSSGVKNGTDTAYPSYSDFVRQISPRHITVLTSIIPTIHLCDFPDLYFFYQFFTEKTSLANPELKDVDFSFDLPMKEKMLKGMEELQGYFFNTPTTEIFWIEAIDSLLKPIFYYHETDAFREKETVSKLLRQMRLFIDNLEKMAAAGKKLRLDEDRDADRPHFELYFTEVPLMESTTIYTHDKGKFVVHRLNGLNLISTADTAYIRNIESLAEILKDKSTNVTVGGEKTRLQFFNTMRRRLDLVRRKVESSHLELSPVEA